MNDRAAAGQVAVCQNARPVTARHHRDDPMELMPTLPIIALEQLPDGELVEREAVLAGEVESVLLLRRGEAVSAWLNLCPHAGRRLDYAPGMFLLSKQGELVCPVHGASFELGHGQCTAGPCRGQSLRALQVSLGDGQVHLALA